MTTLSSVTQGTISSAGIGSGLDVNSIVSKLMAVEQQPLTALQTKGQGLQAELSLFGQMQSAVSQLHDSLQPLFDPSTYQLTSASSTDPSSVSAGTTGAALPGNYSVSVSQLASAQSVVSASGQFTDSTATVGSGSLTIRLGTWSSGAFTPATGSSDVSVSIASTDTLANIRDKINAANAGVTAALVTDASGTRLAIQSSTTGAANGFRIQVADDDGANGDASGLSRLAYDPQNGAGQLALAQSAGNTQATINGIAVTAATNTLSNVIDGMTFNLNQVTTSPVTVNVARNSDAVKGDITAFVTAYNQLNSFLATETAYDPTSKTAAPLQGDSTTVGIDTRLHSLLAQSGGVSSLYTTFSSLGLQLQKDGSIKVDDTTLSNALQNLPDVQKALGNLDPTTPANNGLAKQFSDWTDSLLNTGGTISTKTQSIQSQITSNQNDQQAMQSRLNDIQSRLQAQYSTLDSTMSQTNALNQFITQQIQVWNKPVFGTSSSGN
jgi:flagellar hook-associated protein 2